MTLKGNMVKCAKAVIRAYFKALEISKRRYIEEMNTRLRVFPKNMIGNGKRSMGQ
jgi:hypothetical protein